ncbi:MAG TPA: DPP IV N-terminal domain-containing protein [Gemmatimonadaceae bacterium]|nr:DPP IV N-terminal domain-containing protein [Gemmatimonadaceae bacterium]
MLPHHSPSRSLTAAALVACALVARPAQAQQVDYTRADRMLEWNTSLLITGDEVRPEWYKDGMRFWYRNKIKGGAEFVTVDPVKNTRALLFDNARLAAAMTSVADTAFDPMRLPFTTFKFADDGANERRIEFNAIKKRFQCDIVVYSCTVGDTLKSDVPYVLSPDKKWEAFVHNWNVYVRPRGGGDSTQLTTDGVEDYSYGITAPRPGQLLHPAPQRPNIKWSPDSKRLLVSRQDERKVLRLYYISATPQRPKVYSQPYALPGDSIIPLPEAYVIDVASKSVTKVNVPVRPLNLFIGGSARDSAWADDSRHFYLSYYTRANKADGLLEGDATTGATTTLVHEESKTYIEMGNPVDRIGWHVTKDGQVFWWSERDGWGHIYRIGHDGKVINQVTSGPWQVGTIQYVDESLKQVYFTARGREPNDLIYYAKLYRVNYDGSGLTLLTPEPGNHVIEWSPSGKYFVDQYSRIETPPVTVLRAVPDGHIVRPLEKADVSALVAEGWKPAQVFSAKARDGVTDLYGVIYLPPDLDTTKKYPIVTNVYPGPQVGSVGAWTFKNGGEPFSMAQLGFVVIQLDAMGTPLRSKAFHDNYYGNFWDNGVPDQVAVIKELGARYPFIDMTRIGIWGHSGGGFTSTDAMLRYPDFFKVAVSSSGNHDNRTYNIYWAEKYQGLLKKDSTGHGDNYTWSANKTHVASLKGHLFLMNGDFDDNVNPANTVQMVDALIKANKNFDYLVLPDRQHGLNEPYVIRKRWDYFVRYLLHKEPPEDFEIVRPASFGNAANHGPADPNDPNSLNDLEP